MNKDGFDAAISFIMERFIAGHYSDTWLYLAILAVKVLWSIEGRIAEIQPGNRC